METCPQCKEKNPDQKNVRGVSKEKKKRRKRMLEESLKRKKRMLDESHDAFDFLSRFFPMLFHDNLPLFSSVHCLILIYFLKKIKLLD